MLLRFRVENHASIRDEVELSLVAEGGHQDLATSRLLDDEIEVLPAAAIYGANASGKSNIIDAFIYMRYLISDSHQSLRPGEPIQRWPFKLDGESRKRPTAFTAEFVLAGVRYEYGFKFDDIRILEEWLYSYPKNRSRVWFERDVSLPDIRFGPSLKGHKQTISEVMRSNSLYLSAAAANNHKQLYEIYRWFVYGISPLKGGTDIDGSWTLHQWQNHPEVREEMRKLLTYADFGVVDIEVEEPEVPDAVAEKFKEFIKVYDPEEGELGRLRMPANVTFLHRSAAGRAALSRDEESSGTLAWTLIIGPAVKALQSGGLLVIDELDARLHPLLSAQLVSMFQSPSINKSGAQILFNTHNVTLLSPATPGRLRRDQVWLTEKGATGATSLTPLSAYKVRDGIENFEKRYLNGRYGAIPFLDDYALEQFWN